MWRCHVSCQTCRVRLVDALHDLWESHDVLRQEVEARVGVFLLPAPSVVFLGVALVLVAMVEYLHDAVDGGEGASEVEELVLLQVSVLDADANDAFTYIVEVLQREVLHLQDEATELTHLLEPFVHLFGIIAECHLLHLFLA